MNQFNAILRKLVRSPILWGTAGSIVFYTLIHTGPLANPFVIRYFTGHPVEYAETVLFAVGLAVLVLKIIEITAQYPGLKQSPLGDAKPTSESIEQQCQGMLNRLDGLPGHRHDEYYVGRLRAAVDVARRHGTAEGLDDELKYLADQDATRAHNSFALFRVIIWAIPILGFLGTVIGITMALNALDPQALDESMMHLIRGLGVKFDTTALALGMSMLLMFIHFFVDRSEGNLLETVDRCVARDLDSRFQHVSLGGGDGQVVAVRRMAEAVIQAADRLVQRQAELWHASMDVAAQRWAHMAESVGDSLKMVMADALTQSLKTHVQDLVAAEQSAAEQNRRHWERLAESQTENALALAEQNREHWERLAQTQTENVQALTDLQGGLTSQAEVLGRAIAACGDLTRLQDVLNRNLTALAGAKHFDQAVHSLAAAIHLLNARIEDAPLEVPAIQLDSPRRTAHAA